jgi:hypothetical protein
LGPLGFSVGSYLIKLRKWDKILLLGQLLLRSATPHLCIPRISCMKFIILSAF